MYCAVNRYTVPTTPLSSRAAPAVPAGRLTAVATAFPSTIATVATAMSGVPGAAGTTTVSVASALFTLPAAFDATIRYVPSALLCTFENSSVAPVAPPIGSQLTTVPVTAFFCHCVVTVPCPATVAFNVAV